MSVSLLTKYPADLGSNISVYTDTLTPLSSSIISGLSGLTGMFSYNSTLNAPQYYNGSSWITIPSGGTGAAPFYDRRVIQTTVAGVWNAGAVNVEVDAQRNGDVCTISVTSATGFNGNHFVSGGTGNSSSTAIVDITALPASIYAALHNNPPTLLVQIISGGSVQAQGGAVQLSTSNNTDLDIIWPGAVTGAGAAFYQFTYQFIGVPHA